VAEDIIRVSSMSHLKWEVNVIQAPECNAFVLPGGKIFVFTGILPITQTEDGLAAVLGHEVAHQIARHSAEK
jgi:predicted Zn-dependent protease